MIEFSAPLLTRGVAMPNGKIVAAGSDVDVRNWFRHGTLHFAPPDYTNPFATMAGIAVNVEDHGQIIEAKFKLIDLVGDSKEMRRRREIIRKLETWIKAGRDLEIAVSGSYDRFDDNGEIVGLRIIDVMIQNVAAVMA